jgi:hypothetical protein
VGVTVGDADHDWFIEAAKRDIKNLFEGEPEPC